MTDAELWKIVHNALEAIADVLDDLDRRLKWLEAHATVAIANEGG